MLLLFIVAIIIVIVANQNKKNSGGQGVGNTAKQNTYSNEVSYGQRRNLYQDAIEKNRYHSITKLARDYHLPVHLVMQDIKQLQEDGFLMDIKVEYNQDEIVYLDEESRKMRNKEIKQDASSVKDVFEEQSAYRGRSAAYAKTRTKVQQYGGNFNSQEIPKERKAEQTYDGKNASANSQVRVSEAYERNVKKNSVSENQKARQVKNKNMTAERNSGNQKFEVNISDGITVGGAQEEYQADYSMSEAKYNYIAEYPDTSHIWDELNSNLFPKNPDMLICPKCGTENIIVRNTQGKCNCYYCQGELI